MRKAKGEGGTLMALLTVEIKHYWENADVNQALHLIIYYFMSLLFKLRALIHLQN